MFSELGILISFFCFHSYGRWCAYAYLILIIFSRKLRQYFVWLSRKSDDNWFRTLQRNIVAFFEILTAYAFIYLFNQTVVYKNLNVPEKQKSKLLHIVSLCNVPYLLFIPILKISFVSNIINDIIIGMIYWPYII